MFLSTVYFIAHNVWKKYILNYTPNFIQAYTAFFFLRTKFHVARMQTKFCRNFNISWKVQQVRYAIYCISKLRVCLFGHCWQYRMYISANEPTVSLPCQEPQQQYSTQTVYVVFDVFQFLCKFCPKDFSLPLHICRVSVSNNHSNICGSSSYMSVSLSDFSKFCIIWANLNPIPIRNFINSQTADSRDITFVQKDKRTTQFYMYMSPAGLLTRKEVEHTLILHTCFGDSCSSRHK
jgi:hypothetical protein